MDARESRLYDFNGFWIHSLAGFWIPMPSIPDSTSKNFLDSGIQITLHGAKTSQLFRLNFFEREMAYVPTNYAGKYNLVH